MLNSHDILETINMIDNENLDVRTITMGISLLDCADSNVTAACDKIYDKICRYAGNLVKTGEDISKEYGIPIITMNIDGLHRAAGSDAVELHGCLPEDGSFDGVHPTPDCCKQWMDYLRTHTVEA